VKVTGLPNLAGLLVLAAVAQMICTGPAAADKVGLFKTKNGVSIRYTIVTPFPLIKTKEYPAILAFPSGRQDTAAAKAAIDEYWGPEARKRGYYVFVPEAPKGYLFYGRGVFLMPEFIEHFMTKYKIKDGKLHIAGNSNGGLSAFRIALKNRSRTKSLTVFPGYPATTRDLYRTSRLKKIKVNMFVNEGDKRWKEMMDFTAERLKAVGVDVHYQTFPGEGHKVDAIAGPNAKTLFDILER